MELEPECTREVFEVAVGGEDREVVPDRDGTDQEVGVRALDSALSTAIVGRSGLFVVDGLDLEVRKRSQVFAELLELRLRFDTGQKLLPDRPNHDDSPFLDELCQFPGHDIIDAARSAKRQRPYRGVDQDVHWRRRCFL